MPHPPYKSGTLLIPSGTYHAPDKKHLFIICTDECADGKFALVPISTWANDICDASCRIAPGEHAFIVRESYALYRKARIESRNTLENGIKNTIFSVRDDVSTDLLSRVRNGICASAQTPRKIKSYFGCEKMLAG